MPSSRFGGLGRHGVLAAGVLLVGAVGVATPAARAGTVTIESQERGVGVSVFVAPPDEDFIDISDREISTEPGTLEGSASRDSGREDYVAEGSATMSSTLGQGGFRFAGQLAFEVEDRGLDPGQAGASAGASATIIFSIDEPYRYGLDVDTTTLRSGGTVEQFGEVVLLTDLDGARTVVFTGEGSGVLEAGRYQFDLTRGVGAGDPVFANEGSFTEEYDIQFALEEADGGDGTPIPLPPAVWSGLALMGAGLLNRWRKSYFA